MKNLLKLLLTATAIFTCFELWPVFAHTTDPQAMIQVFKFEMVNQSPSLIRAYKKKWSELVLGQENLDFLESITEEFAEYSGKSLRVVEVTLLDGELFSAGLRVQGSSLDFQVIFASRKLCLRNPDTDKLDKCVHQN